MARSRKLVAEPLIRDEIKTTSILDAAIHEKFEVFDWRNALALFHTIRRPEFDNISAMLLAFKLKHSYLAEKGGNKSKVAKWVDDTLRIDAWVEKAFDTRIIVDGVTSPSPTHKVDCFKNKVALEVEWNNKDPFFDRDLNNFRLLYELRIIDLGIIVTRATALKTILVKAGRESTTYGKATTHTEKLYPKIVGGGAGGCPVLVFGIKPEAYVDDRPRSDP